MVEKKFGTDFDSAGGALTLDSYEVGAETRIGGPFTRTHEDGWTITGKVKEDYYEWVNEFEASHPKLGRVWGDFEGSVYADSEEAFSHFYERHKPSAWDYMDI